MFKCSKVILFVKIVLGLKKDKKLKVCVFLTLIKIMSLKAFI